MVRTKRTAFMLALVTGWPAAQAVAQSCAMCGSSLGDVPLVLDRIGRLTRRVTGPGRLKVWEVKTGMLKHDLVGHSHADAVTFSPDGNLLASAGRWQGASDWGTGVVIWNPHLGKKIRTSWELKTNQDGVATIPPIPQGQILVQVIAKNYQTFGQKFDVNEEEKTIEIKLKPPQSQYSAHQ